MTIETLKSLNPRNRNGISVIKSKLLSVSSMNTLLAILKVTDERRDVILAGGLYHRFPWRHLPPPPPHPCTERRCVYTALSNSSKRGPDSFFRVWGHSRLWSQNQKKASPDPFHENMVRKVYTAKIYGP